MKAGDWLFLSAVYVYFCVIAVAVSHDWNWLEDNTETVHFTDRWLVNMAQISTIGAPFIVGAVVGCIKLADTLSDVVHDR